MRKDWWAPLTGVAFIVVVIVGFLVAGEPPDADSPPREIIDHYVDNKDSVMIGALLSVIAAALLVFFGAVLRSALRAGEGPGGVLSAVAFAGTIIMATGAAIDAMISFALADRADDVAPVGVQALQALWDNDFFPVVLGAALLLLGAGLSIARHAVLPRWLGWVGVLIGILALTPIGFVAFPLGGLWVLIVSVMLTLRWRGAAPAAPAAGGGPV
ncbi:MAG TPA: DUF4386 family protein [Micromonosporaceae bacterium]|nr:DUF4386 family protein [Micromonosporaceae bacterium]